MHTKSGDLEDFSPCNLKRYKTLRSYELYKSGHVHSVTFQPMSDVSYCALKAKCNPSWDTSGTVYDCLVVLSREGHPIGSSCTCTAGLGEACTHVAALLFALEDFTSLGYQTLPGDPTSTEVLCAWNAPKKPKVNPVPVKQLTYKNRAPGKNPNETTKYQKKKLSDHDPVAPNKRTINIDDYHRSVHDLSLCQPDVPFLSIADPQRWSPKADPPVHIVHSSLPPLILSTDPMLIPASEETVISSPSEPLSIISKAKQFMSHHLKSPITNSMVEQFTSSIIISKMDCERVEELTKGQSSNVKWKQYRQGMITSTTVHPVHTRMKSIKAKRAEEANRLISVCMSSDQTFK